VVPLLFQLKPSEVQGPLAQFNTANFDRDDILRLLKSISNAAGDEGLDERRLVSDSESYKLYYALASRRMRSWIDPK
jgi:hypothetical protein